MDEQFSRRWSSLPTSASSTSLSTPISYVNTEKYARSTPPRSYSQPPNARGDPRQRWSAVPTSTSSLSIVETIDYDSDDTETTAVKEPSKRNRSFRGIMRHLFPKREKEKNMSSATGPNKPSTAKSIKSNKKDPVVLKSLEKKEGAWNRLSIVIRPPKSTDNSLAGTPKRVDSGVDIRTSPLKDKRISNDSKSSAVSTSSTLTSLRSSSLPAPRSRISVSSTIVPPLPSQPLDLTPEQTSYLLTQFRTALTLLQKQEHEAEAFSKNLAGLLWDKDYSVQANKNLSPAIKAEMLLTLAKIRDQTAKTFCRKGIYLERSLSVVEKMIELLDGDASSRRGSEEDKPTPPDKPQQRRSPSISSTTSSTSILISSPFSFSNTLILSPATLQSALSTLKADLTAHSHLDPALRNTVVKPTQDTRFPSTANEIIAMRRYVRFVDGRIKKMGGAYWEFGRWVRETEGWVEDLVEGL